MLLLIAVCSTACYNVRYYTKAPPSGKTVWTWNHFFLWGIAGGPDIDVRLACPHGLSRAVVKHSFATIFVSMLTAGLYSPTTAKMWCAAAPKPENLPAENGPSVDVEEPTPTPGGSM